MLGGYGQDGADPAALQRLLNQAALQQQAQQQQQQRLPGMVSPWMGLVCRTTLLGHAALCL